MQLSIIIVNFNVQYFLEQCLCSVLKSIGNREVEVIVVDNLSTDGSVAYLQPLFPQVQFIQNTENVGFAKANNQALQIAKGNYVLFLNPDTIVPENCFESCFQFFETHPNCGALGIRMMDGSGQFLPESKRSFPSPLTSFFKLTGLASIFPKSKIFNRYALGHLPENENHEVAVLAGAFMLLPKKVQEAVKGFDEAFFMYGEDIDLSYRIQQLGYKNYYLGTNSIVHFKGESTKKGSLNYVWMFYQAMSIFVNKHYTGGKARFFALFIQMAIGGRALAALIKSFFNKLGLPFVDALVIYASLWLVQKGWLVFERNGVAFVQTSLQFMLFGFTGIFLLAAIVSGIYDNLYKPSKAVMAAVVGVVVMLAVYSLLPENLRFSRGVMLMGGLAAGLMITLVRSILAKLNLLPASVTKSSNMVVVASASDYDKAIRVLTQANLAEQVLGRISVNEGEPNTLGSIEQLHTLLKKIPITDIVFCAGEITYQQMMATMQHRFTHPINFRFMGSGSNSIIGSNSKETLGEIITNSGLYPINQPYQKRMKRMVDVLAGILLILGFPIHCLFIKHPISAFINAYKVLNGKCTWIGYATTNPQLPKLKKSILTCYGLPLQQANAITASALQKLDAAYAKEYDWLHDLRLISRQYRFLGGL